LWNPTLLFLVFILGFECCQRIINRCQFTMFSHLHLKPESKELTWLAAWLHTLHRSQSMLSSTISTCIFMWYSARNQNYWFEKPIASEWNASLITWICKPWLQNLDWLIKTLQKVFTECQPVNSKLLTRDVEQLQTCTTSKVKNLTPQLHTRYTKKHTFQHKEMFKCWVKG
jgi:hypothetical protein